MSFDNDFDKRFNLIQRQAKRAVTFSFAAAIVWVVIYIALLVGAAMVAWHFISKLW